MKRFLVAVSFLSISVVLDAETRIYGRSHVSINKTTESDLSVDSQRSYIGFKGINSLDHGLTATHQLELGYDLAKGEDDFSVRLGWMGVKGKFGEFRVGRQITPYSAVDNVVNYLQQNGHKLHVGNQSPSVFSYLKKMGSYGFAVAYVATGDSEGNGTADLLLNYSTYPLYAGITYQNIESGTDGIKLAIAVRGSNYALGLVSEKQAITGDKVNTLSGKYIKGSFWLAGQYGKNDKSGDKQKNIEIGYKLGKKTKSYYEWEKFKGVESNRLGLVHDF